MVQVRHFDWRIENSRISFLAGSEPYYIIRTVNWTHKFFFFIICYCKMYTYDVMTFVMMWWHWSSGNWKKSFRLTREEGWQLISCIFFVYDVFFDFVGGRVPVPLGPHLPPRQEEGRGGPSVRQPPHGQDR